MSTRIGKNKRAQCHGEEENVLKVDGVHKDRGEGVLRGDDMIRDR